MIKVQTCHAWSVTVTETCGRPPRSPALAGIVDRLWYVADGQRSGPELKLPTTTGQIVINLDADRLTTRPVGHPSEDILAGGPVGIAPIASTAVVLDRREQRRTVGIVIRAEAIATVADVPAHGLAPLVDLKLLWGSSAEQLVETAAAASTGAAVLDRVEEAFISLLRDPRAPDRSCRAAISRLRHGQQVADVADSIGLSQSTLTRRFRSAVGMTPKRFQRLLRLERAIDLAAVEAAPDWAEIAARCGCSDQPHLTHEFGELTGLTPTQWRRASAADPYHLAVAADFLQDDMGTRPAG